MDASKSVKAHVPNAKTVVLTPSDLAASGGESFVYRKGGKAYKIYVDPQRAISAGMEEKIGLLSKLANPSVLVPRSAVYDSSGKLIGYVMDYCDWLPLVKSFSNAWRDANGFGDAEAAALAKDMRDALASIHSMGALTVDGNEMNYLFSGTKAKIIDSDSWQIGRFKATALMPSIRDYSSSGFSELTDWFAWGIATFQTFVGTHPYKGVHPDFKRGDLEGRMRAGASVFDPKVSLNAAVRDLSSIPPALREWYEGVFQKGERSAPPSDFFGKKGGSASKLKLLQSSSGSLRHEFLFDLPFEPKKVSDSEMAFGRMGGKPVAYDLSRRVLLDMSEAEVEEIAAGRATLVRTGARVAYLRLNGDEVAGRLVSGVGEPVPEKGGFAPLPLSAFRLDSYDGAAYATTDVPGRGLVELGLAEMGGRMILAATKTWNLNSTSARFYERMALADGLGVPFAVVPKRGMVKTLRAAGLKGVGIVDAAAFGSSFVVATGKDRKTGDLTRYMLAERNGELEVLDASPVDVGDVNAAMTPKGVVVMATDADLEAISASSFVRKRVSGSGLPRGARLFSLGDSIAYADGTRVMRLSMG